MHQLPAPPTAAISVLLASAALLLRLRMSWRWPIWIALGFLWTAYRVELRSEIQLAPGLAGQDVWVVGWVDSFPSHATGQVTFSLRLPSAGRPAGVPPRIRLTWYEPPLAIEAGVSLRVLVRLKEPRGLANPGGFDYERWLFSEGYGATGYVREGGRSEFALTGLSQWWFQRRAELARKIVTTTPGADAPFLLTALALGERFGFDDRHWEVLRRTGTSHLMAISGLHIGLVAAFFFVCVRRIWLHLPGAIAHYDLQGALLVSLISAAFYAAAAGFAVPTQRALIMLAVASLAILMRRSVSMTVGLSTAALGVFLWDPFTISGPSFWLSFIAVGLLWQLGQGRPASTETPRRMSDGLRDSVRIQWGICLGLAPVVVLYFGELSVVSPLVNFVAIPVFSLVLVPLTLLGVLALYSDLVGPLLVQIPGLLVQWVWSLLETISGWQWSAIVLPPTNIWLLVLAIIGVLFGLPIHPLPGRFLSALAIVPLLFGRNDAPDVGVAVATVLDVGHGLAVIVETGHYVLLFDAGPRYRSGFDSGREIILPALQALGRDKLDAIVISHADTDHSGGAAAVIEAFPRAQVFAGPDVELPQASVCRTGQAWERDGVEFEFLHPPVSFASLGNDSSCVLKVATREGSLLISGDIEADGERTIGSRARRICKSSIVIVPHHGSATSSSQAFVDAVKPRYAVVSAAFDESVGISAAGNSARAGATSGAESGHDRGEMARLRSR